MSFTNNNYDDSNDNETALTAQHALLVDASKQGNLEKIRQLVHQDTNVFMNHKQNQQKKAQKQNECYFDTLNAACTRGHLEIVKFLFDIVITNRIMMTHNETIRRYPFQRDKRFRFAFQLACENGHYEIVKFMLKYDFKFIQSTQLHVACLSGHYKIVQLFLKVNPSIVNYKNFWNDTALHLICGKDVVCNNNDETGLHIDNDNDNQNNNNDGENGATTASTTASTPSTPDNQENTNLEIAKLLLQHDPTLIHVKNYAKRTPLHCACNSGNFKIVKYLHSIGNSNSISLYEMDEHEETVLHEACWGGHLEIAKWLLQQKPSLIYETTNKYNETLQDTVRCDNNNQRDTMVEYLDQVTFYLQQEQEEMGNTEGEHRHEKIDNKNHVNKYDCNGYNYLIPKVLQLYSTNNIENHNIIATAAAAAINQEVPFQLIPKFIDNDSNKDNCDDNNQQCRHVVQINRKFIRQKYNDIMGFTPLMIASYYGLINLVKLITKTDPESISDKDNRGLTPFLIASQQGQYECAWHMIRNDPVGSLVFSF